MPQRPVPPPENTEPVDPNRPVSPAPPPPSSLPRQGIGISLNQFAALAGIPVFICVEQDGKEVRVQVPPEMPTSPLGKRNK